MHNTILNILFFCLIGMSAVFKIFESENQENTEKRVRAILPTLDIASITEFPEKFTAYVDDNFGGRSSFVALNSLVKAKIFRVNNRNVAYGLEGWLFLSGRVMHSIYNNPVPLSEEELKNIATIQMERKEWLKLHGMDYYLFLPPGSHSIYSEYLPSTFKKSFHLTRREQIIEYLQENTDINIILVDKLLRDNKKNHILYHKGGSHWNFHAGFYVYQYLVDYFREIYPNIPAKFNEDGFNITAEKDKGGDMYDLYDLMKVTKPEDGLDTVYRLKKLCYNVVIDSSKGPKKQEDYLVRVRNTCDTTLPNLFFYRDSYSNVIWQHLSYHFNKTVLLWDPGFVPSITKKESCDIVLYEIVEHLCVHLERENPTELKEELRQNGISIEIKKRKPLSFL